MNKLFSAYLNKLKSDRKKLIAVIVVLVLGGYFLFNRYQNKEEEPIVQAMQVEKGTIVFSVSASGNVISSNIENITTQASGTVSKVYVSDGDNVTRGQRIAVIDLDVQGQQNQASAYLTYISAVNTLKSAKSSYRLTQSSLEVVYDEIKGHDDDESLEMKEDRTRAEVTNDNAYVAVKTAEARLSSAALAYKTGSAIITAPSSGTVKSVTIAEGMNIGTQETASGARANQRVATIATGGLPIATFNISEIDVSFIDPGQKATITLDSISDKTFTGKVASVDRVGMIINNVTAYTAIIQFDTSSDQILPNMAATTNIIIEVKSDILTVPSQAIKYQESQSSVTLLKDGQEINTTVETGISSDTQTEIVSGLSEGDTIITGGTTSMNQTTQGQSGGSMFRGGGMRMIH